MGGVLDRLVAVMGEAAADLGSLSDVELLERNVALSEAAARLEALRADALRAADARAAFVGSGAQSMAAWLAAATRRPKAECAALRSLGRAMGRLPVLAGPLRAGRISPAHVRRLAAAWNRRTGRRMSEQAGMLIGWAERLPWHEFCDRLDGWLLEHDPDGCDGSSRDREERRRVSCDRTIFGMVSGSILLDPVSGEVVKGELDRIEAELFAADRKEAFVRLGREPAAFELARSGDQRRADALVEMARRSASLAPGAVLARPLFTVAVGGDRFRGMCALGSGQTVPPSALARWFPDAQLEAVLFDGAGRRALAVTRRRSFDDVLRRVIEIRDRWCVHPSCDVPAGACQVDHVQAYAHGGLTCQDNGEARCGFHNRLRWRTEQRHQTPASRPPPQPGPPPPRRQ